LTEGKTTADSAVSCHKLPAKCEQH